VLLGIDPGSRCLAHRLSCPRIHPDQKEYRDNDQDQQAPVLALAWIDS